MVSIIISWFNRPELKKALPDIVSSCRKLNGEVIIVNCGGDKAFLETQIGAFVNQVKVLNVIGVKGFNKPTAQNIGAKHSKYENLFFCDCDIMLKPDVIDELLNRLIAKKGNFATIKNVQETVINSRKAGNLELFGYILNLRIKNGRSIKIIDNEEDALDGTRQAPGLLLVRKSDFQKVNGYNACLDGWGWEDQDMICRLTLYAKLDRICYGTVLHISHDDKSRMAGYAGYHDRWQSRDAMFRRALENYDKENFLGTYIQDISSYKVDVGSKNVS